MTEKKDLGPSIVSSESPGGNVMDVIDKTEKKIKDLKNYYKKLVVAVLFVYSVALLTFSLGVYRFAEVEAYTIAITLTGVVAMFFVAFASAFAQYLSDVIDAVVAIFVVSVFKINNSR